MSIFCLLINDSALREAIIEQCAAAKIAAPRVAGTAQEVLRLAEGGGAVVVIDAAAWDGKTAAAWQVAMRDADPPVVLMLGEAGDADIFAETFALPLRLGHLMSRLRYYLETAPLLRDRVIGCAGYRLEPQKRRLVIEHSGEIVRLTEKEAALLAFLADSPQPVTRRDILAAVWGYDERIDTHTLETHIYQLRRKLESIGSDWLVNEGGGYRLARGEI